MLTLKGGKELERKATMEEYDKNKDRKVGSRGRPSNLITRPTKPGATIIL